MTWSIIARDASGAFGMAVASRFFAVGPVYSIPHPAHHNGGALLGLGIGTCQVLHSCIQSNEYGYNVQSYDLVV